jgi:hypothetical protein
MVTRTYNQILRQEDHGSRPAKAKVARLYLKNKPGMVSISIIPTTWEIEVRESQFKVSQGKVSTRSYLKKKIKAKRTGAGLKCRVLA